MATSKSVDITVTHAGSRGPVALPSPYPLQPGYTLIANMQQITGPGNYQLSADLGEISIPPGVTLDAAGHKLGSVWVSQNAQGASNTTLKNAAITGTLQISGDGVTLSNSTIYCPSSESIAYVVITNGNNVSLINNSIAGDKAGFWRSRRHGCGRSTSPRNDG
jgi:hypothetical protein